MRDIRASNGFNQNTAFICSKSDIRSQKPYSFYRPCFTLFEKLEDWPQCSGAGKRRILFSIDMIIHLLKPQSQGVTVYQLKWNHWTWCVCWGSSVNPKSSEIQGDYSAALCGFCHLHSTDSPQTVSFHLPHIPEVRGVEGSRCEGSRCEGSRCEGSRCEGSRCEGSRWRTQILNRFQKSRKSTSPRDDWQQL